jgi:hypothetical protein
MRVTIGDCLFEATGPDEEWVDDLYRKWVEAVRRYWRRPIEDKIAQLQSELREQRLLLRRIDDQSIMKDDRGD